VLIIFSKEIMGIFGPEFKGGWQVLLILGSAYFIIVGTGPLTPVLQMTGKQDIEMVNSLSLLIINIGLNLLLIPAYGMIGGAIATSISLILIKLLRLYQVNRMLRLIPYTRQIIKPLLAGIFSLITCLGFKGISLQDQSYIWFIGGAILSLIVYIIVLFLIRFDPEDKIVFSAIKSKILGQS
jgi:O-antigen/teichoic acid export membrane protein